MRKTISTCMARGSTTSMSARAIRFCFLHGNPTWSYCWRNVIPYLEPLGRCIAPDFIGFGKSDHPDIEYRIFDQIRYIEEFVVQLDLRNITLVIHDWGALVGLNLARRFPERIRAVAFCEFPVKPLGTLEETWPLIAEEFAKFRSQELGPELLMGQNLIVESAIPAVTVRKLSEEEMNYYRAPFPNWESRRAAGSDQGPSGMGLALDIGRGGIVLRIQ